MENLTSAAKTTIIVVFAIYTLFQFFYSFLSRQAMKKGAGSGDFMSKFYTGGRSGGVLVTAMMVSAGVAGAGVFMGVPGYTYTFGAIWMVCCFFSLCTNFMVLGLIGKRVGIVARRTKSNTFVELFMNRYENSKVFGALSCLVVLFFLGAFAVSTITGGGRIFQILTGADYRIGLAIFTALVVVAALTGGVKGVASAIVIQGIVMTISVIVLFVMGVGATPGYTATIRELMQTNSDWFVPKGIGTAISFAFLWGYTTFTMPHVTMSTLTYKDTKTLHNAIKVGAIVVAAWLLCLNGLCFTVKHLFPEGSLATPDLGIPTLAVSVMPPWAAGLVLAGVCGAVQSSVGGMIVSLAGTLVGDLYKNIIDPKVDEDKLKKLNTAGIVVVALVVFLFACDPPALLASLITYATGGMTVAFFHTVLLGLFWKRANKEGAMAGLISGIGLYLALDLGSKAGNGLATALCLGVNPVLMATALSTAIMVVVCLATPKPPYGLVCTWFGKDYPELPEG